MKILPEHTQRVHHRQQLEDMRRVVPLRRRQLAALVRHRVMVPLVVRLRQDRGNGNIAGVRRQHSAVGRSKVRNTEVDQRALVTGRPAYPASLSASKLACAAGDHTNRAVGLPRAVSGAAISL
jgi:hypothetical protein